MLRRPQFTLRTLLTAMLVVAAFFGGILWERTAAESKVHGVKLQLRHLQAHADFVEQDRDRQRKRADGYAAQLSSLGVERPGKQPPSPQTED